MKDSYLLYQEKGGEYDINWHSRIIKLGRVLKLREWIWLFCTQRLGLNWWIAIGSVVNEFQKSWLKKLRLETFDGRSAKFYYVTSFFIELFNNSYQDEWVVLHRKYFKGTPSCNCWAECSTVTRCFPTLKTQKIINHHCNFAFNYGFLWFMKEFIGYCCGSSHFNMWWNGFVSVKIINIGEKSLVLFSWCTYIVQVFTYGPWNSPRSVGTFTLESYLKPL